MQWWNSFVEWFWSTDGQRLVTSTILPFLAVLIAGLVAAAIGRSATKRLVVQRDRETRAAAVAALVTSASHAATWHSQSAAAKDHSQQLAAAADIQVRLLPISGAAMAADWAAHELADMRVNSVSFSFQAEQSLREYRERLVEWVAHPRRAKKLFGLDLERWSYETDAVDPVIADQQRWAAEQTAATSRDAAGDVVFEGEIEPELQSATRA